MMMFFLPSFVISVSFILWALRLAPSLGLIAAKQAHRQHERPTPVIGGLAMFFSIISVSALVPFFVSDLNTGLIYHYLAAASLLVVVGVLDDRFHLPFVIRLIVQIVAVLIMVKHGNVLESLGNLFSKDTVLLGSYSVPMTIFATVGVINALNMSDGLDGLAASLCVITLVVLLTFPYTLSYQLIIVSWLGALIAFLLFNLRISRPARLFMGDAGSTVLGFTIAWLLIYGSQQEVSTVSVHRYFPPIFAVWLLALPLFETVSLMLLRTAERKSPFHADRGHMHHHLLNKNGSVNRSLFILLAWFCAYIALGFALQQEEVAVHFQTGLFILCFILHVGLQAYLRRKNTI